MLLVFAVLLSGAGLMVAFVICLYAICWFLTPRPQVLSSLRGLHVMVTGGSRGIGFATAKEAAKQGAKVTLIARGQERLQQCVEELRSKFLTEAEKDNVQWLSADLTSTNLSDFAELVTKAESSLGPVDVLVNNAGGSVGGAFETLQPSTFVGQMNLNFTSAVFMTRAVLPGMKARKSGRIVIVSSMAGQFGLFGFTAYSASKFALRGFAESLQMEMTPHNVWLTVVYPPDTETEGFAVELATMPKETRLISEAGGLFRPEYVAQKMLASARRGAFACHFGLDGWMLNTITCGMSYVTASPFEAVQQVLLMGLLRFVALFYLRSFDRIVLDCSKKDRKDS